MLSNLLSWLQKHLTSNTFIIILLMVTYGMVRDLVHLLNYEGPFAFAVDVLIQCATLLILITVATLCSSKFATFFTNR